MRETFNVFSDLELRGCSVTNLIIFRNKAHNSKYFQCKWLPPRNIDVRPNFGKSPCGKRMPYEGSTGEIEPIRAGKKALIWFEELQHKIRNVKEEQKYNAQYNLHHYWEIHYARFCNDPSKSDKNKSDRLNDWNGKGFGIAHQKWS